MNRRPVPDTLDGGWIELRWLTPDDAELLSRAVAESVEHLRPWMPWVREEPLGVEKRRELITSWRAEWPAAGEAVFGAFVDGTLAGVIGVRPRTPGTTEIGYWVHAAHVRRGVATTCARLLTELAFSWPDVDAVEIHHDEANAASAGVPRALGYRMVGASRDAKLSPGDTGIDWTWRVARAEWERARRAA